MTENQEFINNDSASEPKVEAYLSIFVYPFFFAMEKFEELLTLVLEDPNWLLDYPEKDNKDEQRHIEYFLPYMQRLLFPAAFWKENEKKLMQDKIYYEGTQGGKRQGWFTRTRQAQRLSKDHVVRLRQNFGDMSLDFVLSNCKGTKIYARWKKVSLLLYSTGVGLLVMEVEKTGDSGDILLSDLASFNSTFNCLEKLSFGNLAPALVNGVPLKTLLLDTFLKPFADRALLETGNYHLGKTFLHYSCLACLDGSIYTTPDSAYYKTFARMQDDSDYKIETYKGTCCGFTPKGIHVLAVVGTEHGPGINDFLRFWRTFYLDIYLHAFYQNLSLLKFSRELSKIDELLNHWRKLEKLQRLFLNFTNKTWFSLVTSAPYGQELWKKWQEVMNLDTLFKEVKLQLSEFNAYTEQIRKRRLSIILNGLSIVGTPLAIIYGLFTTRVLKIDKSLEVYPSNVAWWIVGFFLFIIGIWVLLTQLPRIKSLFFFSKGCLRNYFRWFTAFAKNKTKVGLGEKADTTDQKSDYAEM